METRSKVSSAEREIIRLETENLKINEEILELQTNNPKIREEKLSLVKFQKELEETQKDCERFIRP